MPDRDPVLRLDPSMMVPEPKAVRPAGGGVGSPVGSQVGSPVGSPGAAPVGAAVGSDGLVAPEAAAAAAQSVGSLVRTLTAERSMQVHSGGPTIEDMVRDEIRPLLKHWLDTNLPPLVERLVRAEIERVVGRSVP